MNNTNGDIFNQAKKILSANNITYTKEDLNRPWGGFLVINQKQTNEFIKAFFGDVPIEKMTIQNNQKLSPKLLIVNPHKRLSWQYHHRRSEIWRVIYGTAGVIKSKTNLETPIKILQLNEIITLEKEERHRLIGLEKAAILAEIWQHTDVKNLSDENDIVRVQDDFGR